MGRVATVSGTAILMTGWLSWESGNEGVVSQQHTSGNEMK